MRAPVATSIAIAVGIVVLLGYFVPLGLLQNLRALLIGWAVILAGVAALVGIINLLIVHWKKASAVSKRDYYSIVLILSFLLTAGAGLVFGPVNSQFQHVVTSVQVPIETSLMAMLAVTLAYASLRLLRRRKGWMGFIFVLSAALFLLLGSGVLNSLASTPLIGTVITALGQLPVAGARGILLGIGLGSLAAGLRILLGADRPYSG
jgi:hypothetical protein